MNVNLPLPSFVPEILCHYNFVPLLETCEYDSAQLGSSRINFYPQKLILTLQIDILNHQDASLHPYCILLYTG